MGLPVGGWDESLHGRELPLGGWDEILHGKFSFRGTMLQLQDELTFNYTWNSILTIFGTIFGTQFELYLELHQEPCVELWAEHCDDCC